jgi:acyl-CoA thioester hydrolase
MGATITRSRRLEWIDTDASGYWHHATVWRWLEWLEAELHAELGIDGQLFGRSPRRSVSAEFLRRIAFGDEVTCTLRVTALGRTSATYAFEVTTPDGVAATAELVCVLVGDDGRPAPWPQPARAALEA